MSATMIDGIILELGHITVVNMERGKIDKMMGGGKLMPVLEMILLIVPVLTPIIVMVNAYHEALRMDKWIEELKEAEEGRYKHVCQRDV